jgi:hypothetical protein
MVTNFGWARTKIASGPLFSNQMRGLVKLTTGFPSAVKVAKNLGVSKKVARDLSSLAKHSLARGNPFKKRDEQSSSPRCVV